MKGKIEIKPMGSYAELDKDGYIINPASLEKIQDEWRLVADSIVAKLQAEYGSKLVSVYVRGSVGKGGAVSGVSDIDSFAYIDSRQSEIDSAVRRKIETQIEENFVFLQSAEVAIDSVDFAKDDQFWIAQAALVYGKDLLKQRFKVDREIIFHLHQAYKLPKRVARFFAERGVVDSICVWLCKQILRSGIELCYERSSRYSRDLYRCWETFAKYYPAKSEEMKEVLSFALNPTQKRMEVEEIAKRWSEWLAEEKERLGY